MTILEYYKVFQSNLADLYSVNEAESIARWAFEELLSVNSTQLMLEPNGLLTDAESQYMDAHLKRLLNGEPLQYVLGKVEFFGLELKTDARALIPRPETEELIYLIKNDGLKLSSVLDIGTGSGCIPLALKSIFSEASVSSCDVSPEALSLARENSENTGLDIELLERDILKWQDYTWGSYDLIVSNPPYVSSEDKELMHNNVLKHEPHLALFSEEDPLAFYKAISEFAAQVLKPGASLYFEINESKAAECLELTSSYGFQAEALKDIHEKYRFIRAIKKAT